MRLALFSLLGLWTLRIVDAKEGNKEKTLMILWIRGLRAAYIDGCAVRSITHHSERLLYETNRSIF